jgi:hypothetical protein
VALTDVASVWLLNVDPELLAKYSPGKWLVVTEYGIIRGCANSKEELERKVVPHHGCQLAFARVPVVDSGP